MDSFQLYKPFTYKAGCNLSKMPWSMIFAQLWMYRGTFYPERERESQVIEKAHLHCTSDKLKEFFRLF